MLTPFYVWCQMMKLYLNHLLHLPTTERIRLAASCILRNMTYRLPQNAAKDRMIGFRMLFRLMKLLAKQKEPVIGPSRALVYDGKKSSESLRKNYVEWHTGLKAEFIAREELIFVPQSLAGVFLILLLILSAPFYLLITTLLPRRVNTSLLLFEWVENTNLLWLCRAHVIDRLFFFSPYEKDANLAAILLMHQGVYVSKHPSPGPLTTHNSGIIANELIVSSQYQIEEYQHFKDTMFVNRIDKWFPEFSQEYLGTYISGSSQSKANTIGYYTSASWLRRKQGHADNGHNTFESEQVVLDCLKELLIQDSTLRLIIFLHPREKIDSVLAEAKQYYLSYFTGTTIDFAPVEVKTAFSFGAVDLAVAAYSTTIYERLFCGFKTLAFYAGSRAFPLTGSTLEHIIIKERAVFKRTILTALSQSVDGFFQANHLHGYRYFEYEQFTKMHAPNHENKV